VSDIGNPAFGAILMFAYRETARNELIRLQYNVSRYDVATNC